MVTLEKESKIYVACPYKLTSGGPETLHQLVDKLRNNNINAYIYYFNTNNYLKKNLIPEKFKKYNIKYVTKVEDNSKNVIIIPEMNTELLYRFRNIQKSIWWLSFDFYSRNIIKNRSRFALQKRKLPQVLWPIMIIYFTIKNHGYKQLNFNKDKNLNKYIHFYNCEYIKKILLKKNVQEDKMKYLCGPIRKVFINNKLEECVKENIVVYNPSKGLEFTEKIIRNFKKIDSHVKFIPIKNLTPDEIVKLLKKSKVYIDFGFFPGPERIPREAVCCYCNIITSDLGSAKNNVDVPIPSIFKFSPIEENLDEICKLISEQVYNYEKYVHYFDSYRKKIENQLKLFDYAIKNIFIK